MARSNCEDPGHFGFQSNTYILKEEGTTWLEGNMVILVHSSNSGSDVGLNIYDQLNRYNIKCIGYHNLTASIEPKILFSIIILSNNGSIDQETMKLIFQLKKNDIPIIVIYSKESKELKNRLNKLKLVHYSIEEFDYIMKAENKFFYQLDAIDREYEKDTSKNELFRPIYHKIVNDLINKWFLSE